MGGAGVLDQPIDRHQYLTRTVATCTALYSRLSLGSRQVVKVLEIINEIWGGMMGDIPAYTTVIYWTQRLGLSVYNESCPMLGDKRYALIVDESMMIGSEKLLLTLAVNADNVDRPLRERDITIVDISVRKSWNADAVKDVLLTVAKKIGHDPEFVISDNGTTMVKAIRESGFRHHLDISHSLGMFLERIYKKDPDFQRFSKQVLNARLKYNMQEVAFIQPPQQRTIARFMNMSDWIRWAGSMQVVYHELQTNIKDIYRFVPENSSLIDELTEVMACINKIEKEVKTHGLSKESALRCKSLVSGRLMYGNERQRALGSFILEYFDREVAFVEEDVAHNVSSDPIESVFGVYKSKKSKDKLTGVTPLILVMPLRLALSDSKASVSFDYKGCLEKEPHHNIKLWADDNLSPNLTSKRMQILGKKCACF